MCGIAGFFGLPLAPSEKTKLLNDMCRSLRHRGPDDQGLFSDDHVGLGMRRLSIIDVPGGRQPVFNEDERLTIVFNGEIYNFVSLREDLLKKGHHFTSSSDTEVLLHQYEAEGPACLERLNGMFSFAIWDRNEQSLFIARDRMGIKPLFYYWDGKQFLFASEIKALLATGLVPKTPNETALSDYLTLRYVPQPQTIWKNVYKLLPGHSLTISSKSPKPVIQRYWDIPHGVAPEGKSMESYSEEFSTLFLDAVRLQLIADVPVGVLLSGGLDSSAVAAAIKEVHTGALDSFSVAFKDSPATNELPYARQVASAVGMKHHEVEIDQKDFVDFLPQFVRYSDEPLADLASVPLHYVSKLAREHVKVVLSGEGSDEILGGYDFDRVLRRWEIAEKVRRLPGWLIRIGSSVARAGGPQLSERFAKAGLTPQEAIRRGPISMTHLFSQEEKARLFRNPSLATDSLQGHRLTLDRAMTDEPLQQVLYLYSQSWLADDLLAKADRMTMANSLELRVPFLDHRLVEWAARSPSWTKVGKEGGVFTTKRVLREFARKRLPKSILDRPKQGFPVPVYEWLKGPLKSWSSDLLFSTNSTLSRWFALEELKRVHQAGVAASAPLRDQQRLWQLLILELWTREWLS